MIEFDMESLQYTHTARKTYEQLNNVIRIVSHNHVLSYNEILERMGFVYDACVEYIIVCLRLPEDDDNFWKVSSYISDGKSFDEMVEGVIGWKE